MERITYRKTLDVHKSGVQFLLQGFETADNMSRVIEISLMASGDAIDFPLERIVAMMYVTTPGATEPSINECTIKDNKVVYDVLPIVTEGITTMQLKLIETGPDGATFVLASPKFSVEVTKSDADDEKAEKTTTFTALEEAMAKAKIAYDERFLRMELSSDCIFRAFYADGTTYETDVLKKLFLNGNVLLSESFAHGGTGVRAGEDTDNSKYYSSVSKSEALSAKNMAENSEDILEKVKLHGVYTAFSVNFETGEVEYVSPSFKFVVNLDTGNLDAIGQTYTFYDEVGRVVEEWLGKRGVQLTDLQEISTIHSEEIADLKEIVAGHSENLETLNQAPRFVKAVEFTKAGEYTWVPTEEDLTAFFVIVGAGAGGQTPINSRFVGGIENSQVSNYIGFGGGGGAVIISNIMSLESGMEIPIIVGAGGLGATASSTTEKTNGGSGESSSCMGLIAPGAKGTNGGEMPSCYNGNGWQGANSITVHGWTNGTALPSGETTKMISNVHPYISFSASGGCGGYYNTYHTNACPNGMGGESALGNAGDGGYAINISDISLLDGTDGSNGCGGGGGGLCSVGDESTAVGKGGNGGDGYVAIYTLKRINADKEEGGK